MPTAALLIDWDNLRIALLDGRYELTPAELARGLFQSAVELARSVHPEMRLHYAIAFASTMTLNPRQFRNCMQTALLQWPRTTPSKLLM